MAWGDNNDKVDTYIESMGNIPFREDEVAKTGKDNYITILDLALDKLRKRLIAQNRALSILNKRLLKINRYVIKLEEQMDADSLEYNYENFNSNVASLVETSDEMDVMNHNIVSIIKLEFDKLKEYRRVQKETTNKYNDTFDVIISLQEFEIILEEAKTKFSA